MTEITQADRDAADDWKWALYNSEYDDPRKEMEGDVADVATDFARHRIAARNAALEEAAKFIETNIRVQSSADNHPSYWGNRRHGNTYALEYAEAIRAKAMDDLIAQDADLIAAHRQYGYDQGYYDGRQADGAEERAKIVAWLRECGNLDDQDIADFIEAGGHLK